MSPEQLGLLEMARQAVDAAQRSIGTDDAATAANRGVDTEKNLLDILDRVVVCRRSPVVARLRYRT